MLGDNSNVDESATGNNGTHIVSPAWTAHNPRVSAAAAASVSAAGTVSSHPAGFLVNRPRPQTVIMEQVKDASNAAGSVNETPESKLAKSDAPGAATNFDSTDPVQAKYASSRDTDNTRSSDFCDASFTFGDRSELIHFIPLDICSFFKSELGIHTIEQFASADRFDVARRLFAWYQEQAKVGISNDEGGGVRPLKFVEAQVYSWMIKMNKLRQKHELPPLPTRNGPNICQAKEDNPVLGSADHATEAKRNKSDDNNLVNGTGRRKRKVPTEISSKKDVLLAKAVLGNLIDLATVLPIEECRFLGNKFWIFSVQQLECVLASSKDTDRSGKDATMSSSEIKRSHLMENIMGEMAKVSRTDDSSGGIFASAGAAVTSTDKEGEVAKCRKAAEALVATWEEKLKQRKSTNEIIPTSESWLRVIFPLSGPLSILFPPAYIQFLQKCGITTAYDFLSAKKTENSLLVSMFQVWRERHKFKVLKPAIVARFMLSISTRLHTALSSVPPVGGFTRGWTGCNLQVLTGYAREFTIFECRFTKDSDFLDSPTKGLARRLAKFRETKGMPVLKGKRERRIFTALSFRTAHHSNHIFICMPSVRSTLLFLSLLAVQELVT